MPNTRAKLSDIGTYIRTRGKLYSHDEKYVRQLVLSIARMPLFLRSAVQDYISDGTIADVEVEGCRLEYLMEKYRGDIIGSALTLYVLYKEPSEQLGERSDTDGGFA